MTWSGHSRRGLPERRCCAALAGAASRWPSAVAGGHGLRTSGFPGDTRPRHSPQTRLLSADTEGAAARCPCHWVLSLPIPLMRGFCGSLPFLKVRGCVTLAVACGGSPRRRGLPLNTVSASLPLGSFLPPWKTVHCTAGGLLRQGQALQTSVLADRGRRPCAYRGTGGAHACLTRSRRELVGSAGAACPPPLAGRCAPWLVLSTC
jgi:hypothetical protein